jgi:serine O-acetyltransferase
MQSVTLISNARPIRAGRIEDDAQKPVPFWSALRDDILAHLEPDQRRLSHWGFVRAAIGVHLRFAGVRATFRYRLAHTLLHRGWIPGRIAAGLLTGLNRILAGCSISPRARLSGGLVLPHTHGILVGAETVVGPDAWIFQNVTIGRAPGKCGQPHIGADARIYCGAVVSGPITLGDKVIVGANSVVTRDVPHGTMVRAAAVTYVAGPASGIHPCWK